MRVAFDITITATGEPGEFEIGGSERGTVHVADGPLGVVAEVELHNGFVDPADGLPGVASFTLDADNVRAVLRLLVQRLVDRSTAEAFDLLDENGRTEEEAAAWR